MNNKKGQIDIPIYELFLTYDGEKYIAMFRKPAEYKVGEILCEMDRALDHVDDLMDVLLRISNYKDPMSSEGMQDAFHEIEEECAKLFGYASAGAFLSGLSNSLARYVAEFKGADYQKVKKEFCISETSKKRALKKAGFEDIGLNSVGQAMFTGLILNMRLLDSVRRLVTPVLQNYAFNGKARKDTFFEEAFFENGDLIRSTNIDYRIMYIEDKLTNVYGIRDYFSLVMFEVANCLNNHVVMKECKHCGRVFPLHGRADIAYCSFPFGEDGKTCREIGAQATRAEKLKNDVAASEYRKLYLRIKMQVRRHPEDGTLKGILDELMKEGKEYRRRLDANEISEDMYLEWLNRIEKKYKEKK